MPELNVDQFTERAAICEFDGGLTRFAAETAAAREQGMERWQVMEEIRNANGNGNPDIGADRPAALAGQRGAVSVPGMQPAPEEKNRSMPERVAQAGWAGVVLLALFVQGSWVL